MTSNLAQGLRRLIGENAPSGLHERRLLAAFWLYAGHLITVVGIGASNVLLGLTALLVPWRETKRWLRRGRPLLLAVAAYLVLLGAAIATSHSPLTSLRASSDFFNFLVPIVALAIVRRETQARLLVQALVVIGALVAAQALFQYALAADPLEQRAPGPFSHYMTLGGFLVLVDCLLLAWMVFGDGWRRWWAWVSLLLIQLALLTSYTRNAWIALAVILSLLAAVRAPKLLLAWIPALVVLAIVLPASAVARFGSITDFSDASNYERVCMFYAGLGMVRDRPVLGQGPHMVRERYPLYRHPTATRRWVPHLHNSFLSLAAERGLLSLVAMLALLVVAARQALAALAAHGVRAGPAADLHMGALLVLVATLVTGLFEDYWKDTEIQRVVLLAATLPFCLRSPRDQESED